MSRIVSELIYKLIADEKDLVKGLKAAETASSNMAKKFTETGKKLSLGLTVPIVAAGTAMVKLASDTGESLNAANVVFKESGKIIEEWGKNAAEQAGLTSAEFYQASAVIGAGLTNAGASAEEAAKQTIELTKRAADMASIFNTSVDDALGALQAGLRGEAEPLRRFAVSLDAATISAKAVAMGLVDANCEATTYGLSQARLAIIMEQSSKFQGDFANTSGGLANSMRITTAMVKEQAAELGQQLLPIVLEVVQGLKGAVKWFSDLSDEQKKMILVTAGVAAAIGPLLIGVGQVITAVNTLKTAMTVLGAASGPIGIAILAIGALVAAFVALNSVMEQSRAEQDKASFSALAEETGKTVKELGQINDEFTFMLPMLNSIITGSRTLEESTTDWSLYVDQVAKKYGITNEQAKNVLLASNRITEAQKATIKELDKMVTSVDEVTKSELIQAAIKENWSKKLAADNYAKYQAELKAVDDKKKAEQAAADAWIAKKKTINDLIDQTISKTKTERDTILEQIAQLEAAKGISDAKRLEAIKILNGQIAELDKVELERKALEAQKLNEIIDLEWDAFKRREEEKTAKIKEENAKRLADDKARYLAVVETAQMVTGELLTFARQLTKNESLELDNRYQQEKSAIENSTRTEEEKAAAIKALDQEVARKKAEIAQKNAILEKASAIASIAINTARAVIEALPNIPLSIAIGTIGAIQAAAVLAQPLPEIPSFAQGGSFMVPEGFNNDSFPIPAAMVQSGERVTVETPEQQAQGKNVFQIGTVIASPDGFRELKRQIEKYGAVEIARRGK